MKKMNIMSLIVLIQSISFGADRLITCKETSTSNNPNYREFRINISQNEKTGLIKATAGEKYTVMNTSHTWVAKINNVDRKIIVTNSNKTPLQLVIDLDEKFQADNIHGFKATAVTQFIAKPTYSEPFEVIINDGIMACSINKKILN